MKYGVSLGLLLSASVAFGIPHSPNDVAEPAEEFVPKTAKTAKSEKAIKNTKKDYYAWSDLAFAATEKKEYAKAAEYWNKAYLAAEYENFKANALFYKGYVLGDAGKYKEEIAVYDKLYAEFGDSGDEYVRENVASALFNKAYRLDAIGKREESIKVCDKIINDFGYSRIHGVKVQVAKAYVSKGYTLGNMKKYEESIAVCDEMISEFGDQQDYAFKTELAIAMVNKAWSFGELKKYEEEIKACDEMLAKFDKTTTDSVGYYGYSDDAQDEISSQIANAMLDKAYAIGKLGRYDEEDALHDAIYKRFKDSDNKNIMGVVANALSNKGVSVEKRGKNEEAERLYLQSIGIKLENIDSGAYTNLFELYVIENKEIDKAIEKQFLKYAKNNKKFMLQYEMAKTVKAALSSDQSGKIAKLKKEYKHVEFDDWSWAEIERWMDTIADKAAKTRVKATIEVFKNWDKH